MAGNLGNVLPIFACTSRVADSTVDIRGRNSYFLGMKTTVSEKGQITIPKALRQALGLRTGTVIELRADAGTFIGTKVSSEDVFRKWRGRGVLPKGLSVDAYLERARGGSEDGR